MVNEYVYCPRLYWLEHVAGVFLHNEHTLEGAHVHRRVDKPGGKMSAPVEEEEPWHTRSLWVSDRTLGVTAKLDIAEEEGGTVMPVDTKKGSPRADGTLWPADEVQLVLQGVLLESQGFLVDKVAAYYNTVRRRVVVPLTDELRKRAEEAVAGARYCLERKVAPAPLIDSPKCPGCSLNLVCLPDEMNFLLESDHGGEYEVRRVIPPRDDAMPAYIASPGARVGVQKESLRVKPGKWTNDKPSTIGLPKTSQVNVLGTAQLTTQAIIACMRRDIPVTFFSSGGWYYGHTVTSGSRQVHVRVAQFEHAPSDRGFAIARVLIADKIANSRTLLRRNAGRSEEVGQATAALHHFVERVERASDAARLLGLEGAAAKRYWERFAVLVASKGEVFTMKGRNRRPPRDPVNALLSFGYALLVKDCALAVAHAGLDPYLGVYHTAHHGRPSLALDLMEVFRPLVVESAVWSMISRGEVQDGDFIVAGQQVTMKKGAREALIRAYERRMDTMITHPVFGYRITYRQTVAVHARLLARVLTGELPKMPSFRTR